MKRQPESPRILNIMIVPEGAEDSRTYRIRYGWLKAAGVTLTGIALAVLVMGGSWWHLARRAARADELEREVAELRVEAARVEELAGELHRLETQYDRVRDMFGVRQPTGTPDLWLPPPAPRRSRGASRRLEEGPSLPTSWPLTERGFVTQKLLDGDGEEHPGVDIAVPTDSYIRAAGGGTVVDVGEDPVYGRFVVIDHGDGYQTLYAHASENLVRRGQQVWRNEVIALSGSTGRSTAPHLHFEITLNGQPVDPQTMVHQPS